MAEHLLEDESPVLEAFGVVAAGRGCSALQQGKLEQLVLAEDAADIELERDDHFGYVASKPGRPAEHRLIDVLPALTERFAVDMTIIDQPERRRLGETPVGGTLRWR